MRLGPTFALLLCFAMTSAAFAANQEGTTVTQKSETKSIFEIPVEPMKATAASDEASTRSLEPYRGKVLLIVNVASKCGYTPQYAGLEELNRKYAGRGLRVLGFPSNDFGGQEPGSEPEILTFCRANYGVTFPVFAKVHTKGEGQAELYQYLTASAPEKGEVKWNFEKFLIGRDGRIVGRFRSAVKPDSKELTEAIERELAKK